jgi:hypothetical protein|tara:strand:- start:1108 stop:1296 length:189 start_codon:yes stop_codon:yes gene_type:complete
MEKQDSNTTKKKGNTYTYHGKKLGVTPDPKDHMKRREKDEEEVRKLLRDLIYTEMKNLFVKK